MIKIFVDLDEVLVDFVGAACREWGTTKEQVVKHWTPGVWGIEPFLGKTLGRGEDAPLTTEEFWTRINGKVEFWEQLQPLPWADDVLALVSSVTDDWYIVSSPTNCETCHTGKVRWLKRRFGQTFNRFALWPHKHLLAQPGTILIDDAEHNVDSFERAGKGYSRGVLFPHIGNSRYRRATDPLEAVRDSLHWLQVSGFIPQR